jgi:hypothetical protein
MIPAKLTNYITSSGPKVTMIRLLPSKCSPENAVIKMNIESNDNISQIERDSGREASFVKSGAHVRLPIILTQ